MLFDIVRYNKMIFQLLPMRSLIYLEAQWKESFCYHVLDLNGAAINGCPCVAGLSEGVGVKKQVACVHAIHLPLLPNLMIQSVIMSKLHASLNFILGSSTKLCPKWQAFQPEGIVIMSTSVFFGMLWRCKWRKLQETVLPHLAFNIKLPKCSLTVSRTD